MLAAPDWFVAHDADSAGDRAASQWPSRVQRVRPPAPFNDWTEAAQAGVNLRCWWLPRLGGTEALWNELARWRWGPALIEHAPDCRRPQGKPCTCNPDVRFARDPLVN